MLIVSLLGYMFLKYFNILSSTYIMYYSISLIVMGISILILNIDVKPEIKFTLFCASIFAILHNIFIGTKMLFRCSIFKLKTLEYKRYYMDGMTELFLYMN